MINTKTRLLAAMVMLPVTGVVLQGCSSHAPLHKQLQTNDIKVAVYNNEDSAGAHHDARWSEVSAGKVSQSLKSEGLLTRAWGSTREMMGEDSYSLTLVTRDKVNEIMEEKRKQFESGGYEQLSDKLSKIQGLNVIILTSLKSISFKDNRYESGSLFSEETSECRSFSAYSILHVESIRVDNGEIISTGQYSGEDSESRCNPDRHPREDAFNKEKLILESIGQAAERFASDFKSRL